MWTTPVPESKRDLRDLTRSVLPAFALTAILMFFAGSAGAISIPSAKARMQISPAATAKSNPLAGSATLSYETGLELKLSGKRDPFRLPPPPGPASRKLKPAGGAAKTSLPPGPAGLLIDQLTVQGIVSQDAGRRMTAVVTNGTDVAYFLRPDEAVFDGVVTQITPGAVYFRQRSEGAHGTETLRQVVKRLIPRKSQ